MKLLGLALALTVALNAHAQVVDTVNDGAVINAGTYLNTPSGKTVFKNSAETGIHLQSGQHIRGVEFQNGAATGNGGNIHIDAPTQVVRLDGNIDVRSLWAASGPVENPADLRNGGKVTVDAAYLFQNGNIYAGGQNGGNVQFNVGGISMGPTSRIDAAGQHWTNFSFREMNGAGGNVSINSTGDVDISKGAYITTNGNDLVYTNEPQATYGNNIVIVGSGVNVDGTLYAGQLRTNNFGARVGKGTIQISSTAQGKDVTIGHDAILQTDGGNIKIDSNNNINQNGVVLANGSVVFNGNSDDTPWSPGDQGNEGGTISLTAVNAVNNTGRLQADGRNSNGGDQHGMGVGFRGGKGGVITISAPNISNTGVIRAMGGNASLRRNQDPSTLGPGGDGGTANFVGGNPTGEGTVVTYGGQGSSAGTLGTINAKDPVSSTNKLFGVWKKN